MTPAGRQPRADPPHARSRSGRRPGEGDTRKAILAAATGCFAELGYDRATIRVIAAEAAVDPALIIHYFGSKEALFRAALELPLKPPSILQQALAADADPECVGKTVVRSFLEAWDPPEPRRHLLVMLRSAMTNEAAMGMVRDLLANDIFGPVTEILGVPDGSFRANLLGTQFLGLAVMRYISGLEPLASASIDDLVAAIGPTVQRYLTGDLTR
jgi:AcrR family transcriptional regulator